MKKYQWLIFCGCVVAGLDLFAGVLAFFWDWTNITVHGQSLHDRLSWATLIVGGGLITWGFVDMNSEERRKQVEIQLTKTHTRADKTYFWDDKKLRGPK